MKTKKPRSARWLGADSISQARSWLMGRLQEGSICPCCDQKAELHKFTISWKQAWVLRAASVNHGLGYFHLPTLENEVGCRGACAVLAKWGLLEQHLDADGNAVQGEWRLTSLGKQFADGDETVPKYVYVYNNELYTGQDKTHISIDDAAQTMFNFETLFVNE